ncbi:MAG: T9SS type A sorting domain-containing protein [Bacteroidia bacterium]
MLAIIAFQWCAAQSSVFLRNSSWLDFHIDLQQVGSFQAAPIQYNQSMAVLESWMEDQEVFLAARDSSVLPLGDSVVYRLSLSYLLDTVQVDMRLKRAGGGTEVAYRVHGQGHDSGWQGDQGFHVSTTSIGGRGLTLQFRMDNDDSQGSQDIRLAIHENTIYSIDPADFSNPNVLNVMAYNIQFLPLGVVGLPQAADRADLLPAQFSPSQDVIIFEEAFDPIPRLVNLEPSMAAAGFVHNSGILNDYLPFNGGVIIFSKWPIETTAEYDFELCGPNAQDCLANKGIKYARINKLGKHYHVFGTHFDAGSDAQDLEAKNLQYTEMKNFIAAQGIPAHEPVIWGGDLNTGANNGNNLYYNLRDSIDIVVPEYSGFYESTFSRDSGDVIDHVFIDPGHLLPLESQVFITTFRSLDPVLWDLSEFSDHRAAIARFRYPDIQVGGGLQSVCPGDSVGFTGTADIPVQRAWLKNGSLIPGVTGPGISIGSTTLADSGKYEVQMGYSHIYGTGTGLINQLMNPTGPSVSSLLMRIEAGVADVSLANCPIAVRPTALRDVEVYPNPASSQIHVRQNGLGSVRWEVLDLQGRTLATGVVRNEEEAIDLRSVPAGAYHLRLHAQSGQHSERLIVVNR